jgi:hypothetical protein
MNRGSGVPRSWRRETGWGQSTVEYLVLSAAVVGAIVVLRGSIGQAAHRLMNTVQAQLAHPSETADEFLR